MTDVYKEKIYNKTFKQINLTTADQAISNV